MAELMKVDKYYNPYNASGPEGDMPTTREAPENLFPYDRWEKIVKYYLETAPDSPMQRKEQLPPIQKNMPGFTAHTIYAQTNLPLSTVTRFDTARNQIILGDGTTGKVLMLDPSLHAIDSFKVGTGIADIRPGKNEIDLVTMGILKPSDAKLGQFGRVVRGKTEHVILDSLQRPVQITFGDLNADAKEDVVLCEFGYRHGGLSWLENEGDGHYKKHILRPLPGASNASIYDFDLDGKPDIAVLMTQADEGVFIYYNKGNGQFREERVLTFPPVYGSNSMELCDMNGDGIMDIITTNGDNADYSVILKAYHGIRIFINDGSNHFKEEKFLPVYGVQKVMAADLDNDGDLDLASVAFFPDYEKHPDESFIFWENTGNLNYNRFTFNGSNDGRWMTMDIGDMDHDGDKDILSLIHI